MQPCECGQHRSSGISGLVAGFFGGIFGGPGPACNCVAYGKAPQGPTGGRPLPIAVVSRPGGVPSSSASKPVAQFRPAPPQGLAKNPGGFPRIAQPKAPPRQQIALAPQRKGLEALKYPTGGGKAPMAPAPRGNNTGKPGVPAILQGQGYKPGQDFGPRPGGGGGKPSIPSLPQQPRPGGAGGGGSPGPGKPGTVFQPRQPQAPPQRPPKPAPLLPPVPGGFNPKDPNVAAPPRSPPPSVPAWNPSPLPPYDYQVETSPAPVQAQIPGYEYAPALPINPAFDPFAAGAPILPGEAFLDPNTGLPMTEEAVAEMAAASDTGWYKWAAAAVAAVIGAFYFGSKRSRKAA